MKNLGESWKLVLDNVAPDAGPTTTRDAITPYDPWLFYRVDVFRPLAP